MDSGRGGYSFQVPDFNFSLAGLLHYRAKVSALEGFQQANPDYEKNLAEAQARDSQPYEWSHMFVRSYKDF